MKESGIQWIGKIPDMWNLVRLKDICINKKQVAGEKSSEYERLALTLNGVIKRPKDDQEGLQPKEFDTYQILEENDFVFKMIDLQNISTSRVGLSPYTGLVSPAYIRFASKKKGQFNDFIHYYLLSLWYNCVYNNIAGDGVRSALNATDMGNLKCPFPDENTQRSIVAFLDEKTTEIDSLIEIENQQIEKLKEYKQAVITETVTKGLDKKVAMKDSGDEWIGLIPEGWDIQRFKNLGECRNGLTYSPSDMCSAEEGTLVLRSSNIQNNHLVLDDNVYVNTFIKDELYVKKGDILICSRNGSAKLIGKNILIPDNLNASFGAFMMIYRSIDPIYLRYILCSNIFFRYLGTFLTVSVNQLTGSNFMNIQFPYPKTKSDRELIIKYLDEKCSNIDKLIGIKQQKIEKLEEYKKSLIYEYVTGKKEVIA
ncbi:MAG: restriction endonuclease subunit S [Acholeplasmatales bacterium]|nr:restriction endonuclease subunit S [Acholeplasmatales bacterium]